LAQYYAYLNLNDFTVTDFTIYNKSQQVTPAGELQEVTQRTSDDIMTSIRTVTCSMASDTTMQVS